MTRLLHISASPRGGASESLAIAEYFLAAVRDVRPHVDIDTFDLWDGTLPEFGPAAAGAKMAVFAGQTPTGEQADAWQAAVIYTSAVYGPGRPPSFGTDFQAPYLDSWLRWIGIDDITTVEFRPNLVTGDADSDRQRAQAEAR